MADQRYSLRDRHVRTLRSSPLIAKPGSCENSLGPPRMAGWRLPRGSLAGISIILSVAPLTKASLQHTHPVVGEVGCSGRFFLFHRLRTVVEIIQCGPGFLARNPPTSLPWSRSTTIPACRLRHGCIVRALELCRAICSIQSGGATPGRPTALRVSCNSASVVTL